jgi:hypothetical protein
LIEFISREPFFSALFLVQAILVGAIAWGEWRMRHVYRQRREFWRDFNRAREQQRRERE